MRNDLRGQRAAVTKEKTRMSEVRSEPVAEVLGKRSDGKYRRESILQASRIAEWETGPGDRKTKWPEQEKRSTALCSQGEGKGWCGRQMWGGSEDLMSAFRKGRLRWLISVH